MCFIIPFSKGSLKRKPPLKFSFCSIPTKGKGIYKNKILIQGHYYLRGTGENEGKFFKGGQWLNLQDFGMIFMDYK